MNKKSSVAEDIGSWCDNVLVASDGTLFTCYSKTLEIRGRGWDKRRTKRDPFPDGRICKTESLEQSRQLAILIAQEIKCEK